MKLYDKIIGSLFKKDKKDQKHLSKVNDIMVNDIADLDDDIIVPTSAAYQWSASVNMAGGAFDGLQSQVMKYRSMVMHDEVQDAVDDIVEGAVSSEGYIDVSLVLDDIEDKDLSKDVRSKIQDDFEEILTMMDFHIRGDEIFKRWYVDGTLYYFLVVDDNDKSKKKGIMDMIRIEPYKIRKVTLKGQNDGQNSGGDIPEEYYVYNKNSTMQGKYGIRVSTDMEDDFMISPDVIAQSDSGLFDYSTKRTLSYLHKAIKPLNQLRMIEDSVVIYRLARAPERRVFYIDVGNLSRSQAEAYIQKIMNNYKNRFVYNSQTGEVENSKDHLSMLDDYWLPRQEGGKGTEIDTLGGGQTLGELDDVIYFQKKLFSALNVPIQRLEADNSYTVGRVSEMTREEVRFHKFINRLKHRFSEVFVQALKTHCVLKGRLTMEEWNAIENKISFRYKSDNYFEELKKNEVLTEKISIMRDLGDLVGTYYSKQWVMQNVLHLNDDEIKDMQKEIESEKEDADEPTSRW